MVRSSLRSRLVVLAAIAALVAASCTDSTDSAGGDDAIGAETGADEAVEVDIDLDTLPVGEVVDYGEAPETPTGGWSTSVTDRLDAVLTALETGDDPSGDLRAIGDEGDPRLAWALTDLLRFAQSGDLAAVLITEIADLTGVDIDQTRPWTAAVNPLIAWDLPAPAEYDEFKQRLFGLVDSRWSPLFDGAEGVDWRLVSWGGVQIDDRPGGSGEPCNCIPALDDPAVTDAEGGAWYPDDRIVFGVVIGDEARAYPKNIMEIHEMVNDTLGSRRIGMPYCTLCGSAQAYLTDELDTDGELPVFRTSGLLQRSNKMMYDLTSGSLIDTFTGEATSGPLAEDGVTFAQVSVVTTTWEAWREAHPDTTIVAADGGIGRDYELDPLGGRDDNGPIFPIGDADPRLPVQEPVLGVIGASGTPLAFHVPSAVMVLEAGGEITLDGVRLRLDGAGLRADDLDGADLGGHQAFWFAWSQFHPDTVLWPHDRSDT